MIVTHPARAFAQLRFRSLRSLSGFSPAAHAQGEVSIYSIASRS